MNPAEELLAQYTRCHLSNEMLSPPVVVDELGSLFNKVWGRCGVQGQGSLFNKVWGGVRS